MLQAVPEARQVAHPLTTLDLEVDWSEAIHVSKEDSLMFLCQNNLSWRISRDIA